MLDVVCHPIRHLANPVPILIAHLAEALQYRPTTWG